MTAPSTGVNHESWSEQAAGYALYALDPQDEVAFEGHLTTCARCQQDVAAHLVVAEHLSTTVPGVLGEAPEMPFVLRREIGLIQGPRGRAVRSLRLIQRHTWTSTVAAAVVALVIGGVSGVTLADHGSSRSADTIAGSTRLDSAQAQKALTLGEVTQLTGFSGAATGRVAVLDGHGWLVARGLPSITGNAQQYVVWHAGPDRVLHPIASFAGSSDTAVVDLGATVAKDFGVSIEKAGRMPAQPGTLVLTSA
jgi:anti-sigma factor RsiW